MGEKSPNDQQVKAISALYRQAVASARKAAQQ
ncbi:MAG: hypothetical protein QG619_1319, partial [Pseudomonadota bacterium]|nr:hypothetical protein [Pseudomonadota bacterium]